MGTFTKTQKYMYFVLYRLSEQLSNSESINKFLIHYDFQENAANMYQIAKNGSFTMIHEILRHAKLGSEFFYMDIKGLVKYNQDILKKIHGSKKDTVSQDTVKNRALPGL